jgi:signal transduction histidine kinase
MGYRLTLASEVGKGSTFRVVLPVTAPSREQGLATEP